MASSSSGSSSDGRPATSCDSSDERLRRQDSPGLGLGVLLDQAPLRPDDEVVEVHRGHFPVQQRARSRAHLRVGCRVAVRWRPCSRAVSRSARPSCLSSSPISSSRALNSRLPSDSPSAPSVARDVLAEVLQVLAVVEEVEELLVLARPEQVRAQARAAPEHLPELGLRAHQLEEDQVHDLGDVDAGVEHVHRDRDVRRLVLGREVVDQALRVLGLEGDDARELALVVRVVGVEPLGDELGVVLVLGEQDRLAEPVAAGDRQAPRHQVLQDLVHRVLVEQPLVDRLGLHAVGDVAVLVPLQRVPLVLLLFGQLVVPDPLALELQRHRHGLRRHEEPVAHRLVQRVGVGRHAVLEVEQAVGVAVHLVLRRGRQPDQERVEVVEDGAVLLEHRAVRLVDDDQVEVPGAEPPLPVARLVDQPHHRRIGRDEHPPLGVLLGDQVHRRGVRQVRLKAFTA